MGAVEVYKKTRKRPDLFWNTFVARPPAAAVVALLAGTRVTPDQVTLAAFVVAMAAAAGVVALPGYWGFLAAVVVFELSYVLDCVDGMLARWRGTASATGHLLDFLMDEIKAFVLLGAVAIRMFRQAHDPRWLLLGVGGLVVLATGIAITTFQRRPEVSGKPADAKEAPAPRRSLARALAGLPLAGAKFLVHYPSYILYVAIAGRPELYLVPYVAVNALYALKSLAWLALRFGRTPASR
ncbi:MAG: CDP-alcohol phosphatidyltransferase family protein [Polyangiaceae bacterium]|nr:CDP-alcohol phosphatidyltransferase family protein [Polyangiaceae bacterium]